MPYEEELVVLITGRTQSGKSNLIRVIQRIAELLCGLNVIYIEKDEKSCPEGLKFENGMIVYEYDESISFAVLNEIKKAAGADPYVIHLGGALDRQNVADFSYIPYSEQIKMTSLSEAIVRKTAKKYLYGEIVIPKGE